MMYQEVVCDMLIHVYIYKYIDIRQMMYQQAGAWYAYIHTLGILQMMYQEVVRDMFIYIYIYTCIRHTANDVSGSGCVICLHIYIRHTSNDVSGSGA